MNVCTYRRSDSIGSSENNFENSLFPGMYVCDVLNYDIYFSNKPYFAIIQNTKIEKQPKLIPIW